MSNNAATKRTTAAGPNLSTIRSETKLPAATPARYVERSSANAGARSADASANTRNHAISKPSATNPVAAARNIAVGNENNGDSPTAEVELFAAAGTSVD